uniref:Metalloendopeptidase n=1 Tax=Oncorhynchus kisutch TaxID=8019 RepID=A0A8C7KDP5_ONCKI
MKLMISLGIILGMMTYTSTLPIQNSSVIQEMKRLKRGNSEVLRAPEEMNAMDRILRTNGRLGSSRARGLSFREGDIASSYHIQSRSAITCPGNTCLWPKSVDGSVYVPYIISPQYDDMDRITIEMGMLDILLETCVKFVPRSHETNFLDIQPRFGCWSFLGMTEGPQPISLQSPGCMWSGIVSHELMHALGFVHEQSRSDRDRHVSIIWENIRKGQCPINTHHVSTMWENIRKGQCPINTHHVSTMWENIRKGQCPINTHHVSTMWENIRKGQCPINTHHVGKHQEGSVSHQYSPCFYHVGKHQEGSVSHQYSPCGKTSGRVSVPSILTMWENIRKGQCPINTHHVGKHQEGSVSHQYSPCGKTSGRVSVPSILTMWENIRKGQCPINTHHVSTMWENIRKGQCPINTHHVGKHQEGSVSHQYSPCGKTSGRVSVPSILTMWENIRKGQCPINTHHVGKHQEGSVSHQYSPCGKTSGRVSVPSILTMFLPCGKTSGRVSVPSILTMWENIRKGQCPINTHHVGKHQEGSVSHQYSPCGKTSGRVSVPSILTMFLPCGKTSGRVSVPSILNL